ncbi:hypothetical protein FJN13_14600 [Alteromonas mediterranea]|uniref:hypothetical protein n=1 Tax=Alteromonas mediterranea TaxID=314275 RepID=UPI0011303232|nr:hypothetical protein [Alteromonas mediterranea]QDG35964.1 hypothetical protein FJN13_14600 [Alteromonas mediterranea]|tara:strand:+ start:926 stop:1663 length:738 start_codon:yes stop_codon:yes gene_type:complete
MNKRIFNIDTALGVIGVVLSSVSLLGNWSYLISAVILISGLLFIIISAFLLAGQFGSPYKYLNTTYKYSILDEHGRKVRFTSFSLVKVRRKNISLGGCTYTQFPHDLKTYIAHPSSELPGKSGYIEVSRSEIRKQGGRYTWDEYYRPPLRRGQQVWLIHTFLMKDEFTEKVCSDYFNSFRRQEKFTWNVEFPPQRPAKRWWGSADYLPNKSDNYVLEESVENTTSIVWSYGPTKVGSVYYLNWEW